MATTCSASHNNCLVTVDRQDLALAEVGIHSPFFDMTFSDGQQSQFYGPVAHGGTVPSFLPRPPQQSQSTAYQHRRGSNKGRTSRENLLYMEAANLPEQYAPWSNESELSNTPRLRGVQNIDQNPFERNGSPPPWRGVCTYQIDIVPVLGVCKPQHSLLSRRTLEGIFFDSTLLIVSSVGPSHSVAAVSIFDPASLVLPHGLTRRMPNSAIFAES
ncbi:hypothetical protein M011DRAFT_528791 [Sporormia fimetaria CBS 119925]|uniref:Uncharacterized protein n=1 Tax=Sporormia fimetaria CBS 119925 TaxID=1340428 RepID=A0A6A6V3S0_9PLEO|nr:hypothetical protein M011DRAFT_528791 [Sporormia fimetaria CBS 119925]